jgi:hypothetical protein
MTPKVLSSILLVIQLVGGVGLLALSRSGAIPWVGAIASLGVGLIVGLGSLLVDRYLLRQSLNNSTHRPHGMWYTVLTAGFLLADIFGLNWQASLAMVGFFAVLTVACVRWERHNGRRLLWNDVKWPNN